MNGQPYCALEARSRGVWGCLAEPAFGHALESFQIGWNKFPNALTRFVKACMPYMNPRNLNLVVCPDDPWPSDLFGMLDGLESQHPITTLNGSLVRNILLATERVLDTKSPYARPHLMAFLAQHTELLNTPRTDEAATAWAIHYTRDQLLKAELWRQYELANPDPWWAQINNPIGTCVHLT